MSYRHAFKAARPALASFVAMGCLWGSIAATLPDLKVMLEVGEAELGLLLITVPIAAVVSMAAAPWIGARLGRFPLPVATALMALTFTLPGHAANIWLFPSALVLCGAATGLVDVLMNARTAQLEEERGLYLMNLAHGSYSFAYAGGAMLAGLMRWQGWSPAAILSAMSLLALGCAIASTERDGTIHGLVRSGQADGGRKLGLIPVIGGLIILAGYLVESAGENWAALHIEQTLGGAPALGAMGPALIALMMGISRMVGQGIMTRVNPYMVVGSGALIATFGSVLVGLAWAPAIAYIGFAIVGIGNSVVVPTAFSLIGRLVPSENRARSIARATMLGYFGFFFGPGLLGLIAGAFGLPVAFFFTAGVMVSVLILIRLMIRAARTESRG